MIRYLLAFLALVVAHPAGATEAGWALLRDGGHVVLMRHAYAQGMAEPSTFDIEKCNTQRRLSDRGKQQARRIGSLIAARAAPTEKVLSSRLCRALETADIAFGRDVEPLPALDPPIGDTPVPAETRTELMDLIAAYSDSGNMILVTDLKVIEALTGQGAREGEAVIVRPDGETLHVMARIVFN